MPSNYDDFGDGLLFSPHDMTSPPRLRRLLGLHFAHLPPLATAQGDTTGLAAKAKVVG
jgi:hypothetical protein